VKKNSKKILAFTLMSVFIVSTLAVAGPSLLGVNKSNTEPSKETLTGTPADNYPVEKRTTFCGTNSTKSNGYITEFNVPTFCTQPLAITTDPSGSVWFTGSNTGKIIKFDPFTRLFTEYENTKWPKGDRAMMWGIAYAGDGSIWYTDEAHRVIWKFSTSDKSFSSFKYPVDEGGKTFPQRLVIDGDKILVNDFDGNKITFFDSTQSGQEIKYSTVNSPITGTVTAALAVDSSKKIWYTVWNFQTGEGNLIRYDPQTSNGSRFNFPIGMRAPNGISVDKQDKIWLSDTSSSFFFSFDPQSQHFTKYVTSPPQETTYGNSSGLIKTPVTRPYWNSFDEMGRLWFNEQTGNSIGVFDPSKESLVEYLIPSQNPNWSDCTGIDDCGIAQVLDFTVSKDKIWFTEWVENNIGVLDSSIPLPIEVNVDKKNLILSRGDNSTIAVTITPNKQLTEPITLTNANTASLNDIKVISEKQITLGDQPETVSFTVSVDKFALSGTYKILLGARYQEVTVSQYVMVTVK
jgi:virginiamycin B lyase